MLLYFLKIKACNYFKNPPFKNIWLFHYHHLLFFFSLQNLKSSIFMNYAWELLVEPLIQNILVCIPQVSLKSLSKNHSSSKERLKMKDGCIFLF